MRYTVCTQNLDGVWRVELCGATVEQAVDLALTVREPDRHDICRVLITDTDSRDNDRVWEWRGGKIVYPVESVS